MNPKNNIIMKKRQRAINKIINSLEDIKSKNTKLV